MWTRSAGNTAVQARRPDESGLRPMTADEVGFLIDRAGSIWAYEKDHVVRRLPPDEGSAAARRVVTYDFDVITGAIHVDREGNYWSGSSMDSTVFITRP